MTISRSQWPGRAWDWEARDTLLGLLLEALRELSESSSRRPTAYIRISTWPQNVSEAISSRDITLVLPGRCVGIKLHGAHTYIYATHKKLVIFTTPASCRLHGSAYHGMARAYLSQRAIGVRDALNLSGLSRGHDMTCVQSWTLSRRTMPEDGPCTRFAVCDEHLSQHSCIDKICIQTDTQKSKANELFKSAVCS